MCKPDVSGEAANEATAHNISHLHAPPSFDEVLLLTALKPTRRTEVDIILPSHGNSFVNYNLSIL